MEKHLEKSQVLKDNPMVDPVVVDKHQRLEAKLVKLGVDTGPKRVQGYKPRGVSSIGVLIKKCGE